jgi:hypothetical protein
MSASKEQGMLQRLRLKGARLIGDFRRDTSGIIAIMVVLLVPVMVGMMGLTVDVGLWYAAKRTMQNGADAAALAAGTELINGGDSTDITRAAQADADRNGYNATTDTLVVNNPPTSGGSIGDDGSVEVIITRELPLFFSTIFLKEAITAQARAVVNSVFEDEFCILGLDPTESKAVEVSGTATATFDCGIAVNSDAGNALSVGGAAEVSVTTVTTVGDIDIVGGGDLETDAPPRRGAAVDDPYDDLEVPDFLDCDEPVGGTAGGGGNSGTSVSGTETFDAGGGIFVFCNGFSANSGADVTFEPGTYIIDQGDFQIAGGASITGEGVTIILTSSGADNKIGKIQITGGAAITLSAPTEDLAGADGFSGVLFYQDRNVSSNASKSNLIAGGSELDLAGALYFPSQSLKFAGGSSLGDGCTQLIAQKVTITGDTGVQGSCSDAGTRSVGRLKAKLGE